MKTNTLYKRTFNQCLDVLARASPGSALASEPTLASELGVSRTTLRAVLAEFANSGIVALNGRSKVLLRRPRAEDYLSETDLGPLAEIVERKFMTWMVGPDCRPGQSVNALDLARQFGVSTTAIRECLNTFSHFGLLERQSNGRWKALGLTVDFVAELFDMREFMEFRAVERFVALPRDHVAWRMLALLEQEHREMLADIDRRYRDFSDLDHRFHRLVNGTAPNRFFINIQGVMSVIFHYHYQWNKKDERQRNHVAMNEHLAYIAALKSGDLEQARQACGLHLKTARSTLLASVEIASD
ncbi:MULTISPECIES: GntR family transcriptional regulator [Rhizobium]|uniref:DNA-binding GntR family transcriptional regulator n=1 Tax=Rhizobium paranaense TaxID=1650438 RepID=A0A7W8XTP1_9HYPH|nr:GntR family transcriptional regulator [Rhizobium paranaense]MBB5575410.1 DNA-binding GntR family transcriptional regulator [Rhizobium paranaense]